MPPQGLCWRTNAPKPRQFLYRHIMFAVEAFWTFWGYMVGEGFGVALFLTSLQGALPPFSQFDHVGIKLSQPPSWALIFNEQKKIINYVLPLEKHSIPNFSFFFFWFCVYKFINCSKFEDQRRKCPFSFISSEEIDGKPKGWVNKLLH